MKQRALALLALRWSVAVISAWGAARQLISIVQHRGPHIPQLILLPIAIAEIIGAVMLVMPAKTGRAGGILLLVVYGAAALVHVLHGQYDIGNLILLAAAVWVIVTQ